MDRGLAGIKVGVGTDEIAALLPKAEECGVGSEMEAFGLQFADGVGLGLHERPIISRLDSLKEPVELQVGMVCAVDTYCPASDGFSAARSEEEEVVVTADGPRILTLPGPGSRRGQPLPSSRRTCTCRWTSSATRTCSPTSGSAARRCRRPRAAGSTCSTRRPVRC